VRTKFPEYRAAAIALRFRADEMMARRAVGDLSNVWRYDAQILRKTANHLLRGGLGAAIAYIDRVFDTVPREEANVAMVAGGALSPQGGWLTAKGLRDARNLRARIRRSQVIS